MDELKTTDLWVARISSIGGAQARYLWLLMLFGILFLSLKPATESASFEVPGIGFPIDVNILEAAAPLVLSILVILVHGTMRAHGGALRALGFERDPDVLLSKDHQRLTEAIDASPNPLDFAAYTWEKWERSPYVFLLMNYPLYLATFLVEALYLGYKLVVTRHLSFEATVLTVAGGLAFLIAISQTIKLARTRLRKIRAVLKRSP